MLKIEFKTVRSNRDIFEYHVEEFKSDIDILIYIDKFNIAQSASFGSCKIIDFKYI